MVARDNRRPDEGNTLPAVLLGGVFLVLGLLTFAQLVINVGATLNAAGEGEAFGTTLLRFLDTYGIIVPLILVGIGVYLLALSLRLFRREANAAAWARQLLVWLLIASIVFILQSFVSGLTRADGGFGVGVALALPWVVVLAVVGALLWWLNTNIGLFSSGSETLSEASTRVAWNLLLPTVIVLVVVAMRPLESTFIASLTNQRFASAAEPEFVGFDNYAQLLGFRFDAIQCEIDENGACQMNENGERVYPRARDVLDESYRELRFRDVGSLDLGQTRILFSARDRDFIESISNTLVFTFFSVTIELILGLFIAMVINSRFPGRGLMRAAMLVPWAIPTVVSARLWEIMLRDNQSGVVNNFLTNIGVIASSQAWLANTSLQIPALVAVDVWKTTPFMALILLAGLQTIPEDIYEAASVDGANRVRQFFNLTLPLLRPTIAVALVFRTLDAVRVFDVFQVLLGRQRLSMATYNYETLVQSQQLGYASAIGVVIFIIILLFTITYVRILGVNAE
jgi:trehalose/maltose transport system permease protein